MADRLIALLNARIALILTSGSVGTGSFIAPGILLTCAHVVRQAYEANEKIEIKYGQHPVSGIPVEAQSGKVAYISAQQEGKEYPDIAIIKIKPITRSYLKMAASQDPYSYRSDQEYVAIGFQKRDRNLDRDIAQTVSLNYEGEEDAGGQRKITFENGLVRPGMSGAPLLERSSGVITGIIQMTRNPNDDLGAYVIPIDKIWETLQFDAPELYAELHSSVVQKSIRKQYRQEYSPYSRLKAYGLRLLFLPLILFAGLFWVFYHLGAPQNSGALAAVLVVISLLGAFLGQWLGADVASEAASLQSTLGQIFIHPIALLVSGLAVLCLWTFTSSIWIYGGPEHAGTKISMQHRAVMQTKEFNEDGQVQFFLFTTPFSDSLTIAPEQREGKITRIKSLTKKKMFYPQDFLLEPVLLLRLDPNYPVLDKYQLKITNQRNMVFIDTTLNTEGAILLGKRNLTLSDQQEKAWLQELGVGPEIGVTIIERWKTIKRRSDIDLDMGDRLTITMTKKSDQSLVNQQTYAIRDDATDRLFMMFYTEN